MKIKVINFGYESLPLRAHANDAGADIYSTKNILLGPHESRKIPLGLGLVLPDGYMACVYPRSGLAAKGITCELPPIDSGYRGEIHAIITNNTSYNYRINDGDRIGQLVITPVVIADFITDDIEERGANGFGSTGK